MRNKWTTLFLAAFIGILGSQQAEAFSNPLPAISEAITAHSTAPEYTIEAVYPITDTATGEQMALIICVDQKTLIRDFYIVQPPLGLENRNAVSMNFSYRSVNGSTVSLDFGYRSAGAWSSPYAKHENVSVRAPAPVFVYEPPVFMAYDPAKQAPVYRKQRDLSGGYTWDGPAGSFFSSKDVPGFAIFDTETEKPKSSSWVDKQMYKASIARELRTGDAAQYEANIGLYYMANFLLMVDGAYSLKAGLATRTATCPEFTGANAWSQFRSAYKGKGLSTKSGSYFSFSQGYSYMKNSPLKYDIWQHAVTARPTVSSGYGFAERTLISRLLTSYNRGYGSGIVQCGSEFSWGLKGPLGPGDPLLYSTKAGWAGYMTGAAWAAHEAGGWTWLFEDKQ